MRRPEGEERQAGPERPLPVMQHVIDQVDEVQPQLKVCPISCDAVSEVARHQLTVWRGLSVAEHPVLPGLQDGAMGEQGWAPPARAWAGARGGQGIAEGVVPRGSATR